MSIRTTRQKYRMNRRLIKNNSTNESCNTYTNKGSTGFDAQYEHILIPGRWIDYTTAMTAVVWVQGPRDDQFGPENGLFSKYKGSDGLRAWTIMQAYNASSTRLWGASSQYTRKYTTHIEAPTYLNNTTWRCWGFTWADDTLVTYGNGAIDPAPSVIYNSSFSTIYSSIQDLVIGALDPDTEANHSQYPLHDAAIWNTTLTADQMADIYNSGTPTNLHMLDSAPSLKHWWKIDSPFRYPKFRDYAGDIAGTGVNIDPVTNWNAA